MLAICEQLLTLSTEEQVLPIAFRYPQLRALLPRAAIVRPRAPRAR